MARKKYLMRQAPPTQQERYAFESHSKAICIAEAGNSRLTEAFARIHSFKKCHTQNHCKEARHFDWIREHATLRVEVDNAERVIAASVASYNTIYKEGCHIGLKKKQRSVSADSSKSREADTVNRNQNDPSFEKTLFDTSLLIDLKRLNIMEEREKEAHAIVKIINETKQDLSTIREGFPKGRTSDKFKTDLFTNKDLGVESPYLHIFDTHGACTNIISLFSELLLQSRERLALVENNLETKAHEYSTDIRHNQRNVFWSMRKLNGSSYEETDYSVVPPQLEDAFGALEKEFISTSICTTAKETSKARHKENAEIFLVRDEIICSFREIEHIFEKSKLLSNTHIVGANKSHLILDGWDKTSHKIFTKCVRSWERGGMKGGSKKVISNLCMELPNLSDRVASHLKWWDCIKSQRRKEKAAYEDRMRQRDYLTKAALKRVETLRTHLIESKFRAIADIINNRMKKSQRDRLRDLREAREKISLSKIEEHTLLAAKEGASKKKRERREVLRRDCIKQDLVLYRERLQNSIEYETMKENHKKQLEVEERKRRGEQNKKRILFRSSIINEKAQQHKEKTLDMLMEEQQRIEKLNALARKVPYYNSILNAKADLQKTTVARFNDFYQEGSLGLADFQHGTKRMHFFPDEKIFSDVRFRLGVALREAGVAQSSYARAVVKEMIPREPERTILLDLP